MPDNSSKRGIVRFLARRLRFLADRIDYAGAPKATSEAALREITLAVRPVHDAGGEDYRPVVAGEVVPADFEAAGREHTARMRASVLAPKPDLGDVRGDLARDMRDLRELEGK